MPIIHTFDGESFDVGETQAARLHASGHVMVHDNRWSTTFTAAQFNNLVKDMAVCDFCTDPTAPHTILTTPFEMFPGVQATAGWAACDVCYELVQANKRPELLRRAIDHLQFGKFTAAAIAGLHKRFWTAREEIVDAAGIGAAFVDYINDTLQQPATVTDRDKRLESVRKLTGLTPEELRAIETGDLTYKNVAAKLVQWHKRYGTDAKRTRNLFERVEAELRRPLPPGHVPHWQAALDAKFEVTSLLEKGLAAPLHFNESTSTDLTDPAAVQAVLKRAQKAQELRQFDFATDIKMLRVAETYSFNEETIAAIREAGKSIPHDAPLSSVATPNIGAGWFWFAAGIPVISANQASDRTLAVLWSWDTHLGESAIRFSAYTRDEKDPGSSLRGKIVPTTKWFWPFSMTFHDMIALSTVQYRQSYGPGGRFEHEAALTSEKQSLETIAELSLFFLAACMWFKQKILVSAHGPIERHARKRYVREHKLAEPPSVRVIALRASYREAASTEKSVDDTTKREYHYRWIVRGHPRLQVCGPGRKDRKLIWISAYPAGPQDKPLKTRETVYAVIR